MTERHDAVSFYTIAEVADILRVHRTTVQEMIRRGELPAMRVGRDWRIARAALQEKALVGDVHTRLIDEISEQSAERVVQRLHTVFSTVTSPEATVLQLTGHRRQA
jgi:excisionase family DNA binding protein